MDNIKPTSSGTKDERPRVEKVVTGNVTVKKKNGFGKFFSNFFGDEEEIGEIKHHIVGDLVVPTIKDILLDSLAALLGVSGRRSSVSRRSSVDRVSYGRYYEDSRARPVAARTTAMFNTDDVSFAEKGDAEFVLDRMFEMLERYGVVRVTDFYDLAGVSVDYTATKYGWSSLRNAKVMRTRDGYIIDLPRAMPID